MRKWPSAHEQQVHDRSKGLICLVMPMTCVRNLEPTLMHEEIKVQGYWSNTVMHVWSLLTYLILHIFDNRVNIVDLFRVGAGELKLQCGEDPSDALSCRSCFAKEPLIIGLFCGK